MEALKRQFASWCRRTLGFAPVRPCALSKAPALQEWRRLSHRAARCTGDGRASGANSRRAHRQIHSGSTGLRINRRGDINLIGMHCCWGRYKFVCRRCTGSTQLALKQRRSNSCALAHRWHLLLLSPARSAFELAAACCWLAGAGPTRELYSLARARPAARPIRERAPERKQKPQVCCPWLLSFLCRLPVRPSVCLSPA